MKTWKKIEETKKRTGDIQNLKKRNEDKIQKVSSSCYLLICFFLIKHTISLHISINNYLHLESSRLATKYGKSKDELVE